MKFYKNINLLVGIALLALIFNACALLPTQKADARKHSGAATNHLNIQQKKDIQLTGSQVRTVGGNTTDNSTDEVETRNITLNGYQGSLTYGLTDKFAISSSLNYMDYQSEFTVGYRRNRPN